MRRVAATARELGTPDRPRVLVLHPVRGSRPERYRAQVIDRMAALAEIAAERGPGAGAREREGDLRGHPGRCADLITAVNSPALRATFDAANFVQCGVRPFTDGLRPGSARIWSTCRSRTPSRPPARWCPRARATGRSARPLAALRDSGFAGFMSLEPHLAGAGRFGGFSGPEGLHPGRPGPEVPPGRAGNPLALTGDLPGPAPASRLGTGRDCCVEWARAGTGRSCSSARTAPDHREVPRAHASHRHRSRYRRQLATSCGSTPSGPAPRPAPATRPPACPPPT